jgi:hypothetical protein
MLTKTKKLRIENYSKQEPCLEVSMTTLITSSLLHSVSAKMEMHPSHNSHLEKSPNCCGPH